MGDAMILNRICNYSLGLEHVLIIDSLSIISLWFLNFLIDIMIQIIFFEDKGDPILPYFEVVSSPKLILKLSMMMHFEIRTSIVNKIDLDLTKLSCLVEFWRWLTWDFLEKH